MELKPNELAVFENGHKADASEARWNERRQAYYYASDECDETGKRIIYWTTKVIEKPKKKRRKFDSSEKTCTVEIYPVGETEKAYQVPDGTNGKTRHVKEYYKYIAKSICYVDENGRIYAPKWAV